MAKFQKGRHWRTEGLSISDAVAHHINLVKLARSERTAATYRNGLNCFLCVLSDAGTDPNESPVNGLNEDWITEFATRLKEYSPATEALYLASVAGFFEFLAAEGYSNINLPRMRLLIRQRSRKPGQRLPQFPKSDIDEIIEKIEQINLNPVEDRDERMRNLRDRAFLITLADTGLRVHEACGLRRGDIDWHEGKAIIIGKGNKESVVRFSTRAIKALQAYMRARSETDGGSGRPLTSLPLFSRHDRGAGKKVKPITTTTGRNIVTHRVRELLGSEKVGAITPHSFRHYFVTRILQSSGNLKLAQELARHQNIAVTQRYAHLSDDELDKGFMNAIEGSQDG